MKLYGHKTTAANFRELARYVAAPANKASRAALQDTLEEAKRLAPFKSGALRRSLKIFRLKRSPKTKPTYVIAPTGEARRYGFLLEYGLGRVPRPRPFLRPAFESKKSGMPTRFNEIFWPAFAAQVAKVRARVTKRSP